MRKICVSTFLCYQFLSKYGCFSSVLTLSSVKKTVQVWSKSSSNCKSFFTSEAPPKEACSESFTTGDSPVHCEMPRFGHDRGITFTGLLELGAKYGEAHEITAHCPTSEHDKVTVEIRKFPYFWNIPLRVVRTKYHISFNRGTLEYMIEKIRKTKFPSKSTQKIIQTHLILAEHLKQVGEIGVPRKFRCTKNGTWEESGTGLSVYEISCT